MKGTKKSNSFREERRSAPGSIILIPVTRANECLEYKVTSQALSKRADPKRILTQSGAHYLNGRSPPDDFRGSALIDDEKQLM